MLSIFQCSEKTLKTLQVSVFASKIPVPLLFIFNSVFIFNIFFYLKRQYYKTKHIPHYSSCIGVKLVIDFKLTAGEVCVCGYISIFFNKRTQKRESRSNYIFSLSQIIVGSGSGSVAKNLKTN